MKNLIYILMGLMLASACKKDGDKITTTPYIEFVSVTPEEVQEFEQVITFTIFYQDGDGDLGENLSEVKNLFLKDNRNSIVYEYRVEQLAPDDANIAIQGNLNIELSGTGITDGSSQQTATFEIYMLDRAGNQSNTITSTAITVSK